MKNNSGPAPAPTAMLALRSSAAMQGDAAARVNALKKARPDLVAALEQLRAFKQGASSLCATMTSGPVRPADWWELEALGLAL